VTAINDPKGILFPHLETITPRLKELFDAAFLSIRPATRRQQSRYYEWLLSDNFFHLYELETDITMVGDDFLPLYTYAAASVPPSQIVHLCFIDRVAYALQSQYQGQFQADMQKLRATETPLIYQRSTVAWETHPQNYRELEQMVTRVGEFLFGKSLDFAWCHLAIQAGRLKEILPHIQARDFSFEAEMVLQLKDEIQTKEVDWLSWEDPFIEKRDTQALKSMREASLAETNKRLSYVVPMLQLLRESQSS